MANIDIKKVILGLVLFVIVIIVIFYVIGATSGDLVAASNNASGSIGNTLNGTSTGLPMASLFSSSGVLMLVLMVSIFIGVLILIFKEFK